MRFDPLTLKKINRFKSIKRGYWSLICLTILIVLSLFAEVFVNSRALLVKYQGSYHLPTYQDMIPGRVFGLGYDYETNYRDLKNKFKKNPSGNFVIMPIVPFNEYENDLIEGVNHPSAPSFDNGHFIGTDKNGRDKLARLIYGFRITIFFAFILEFLVFLIGVAIGCLMGYYGGKFDLIFQRIIEIWTNIPFLYVVIIIASITQPNFILLVLILLFFSWPKMTWYMRTALYKEKEGDYVMAARTLGASDGRIIFKHILPNTVSIIITFIPFSISGAVVTLTSLDYLGFGLPAPTPSWGELLRQGTMLLESQWIVSSVIFAMVLVLTMVTFIGEAVREAFDPKKFSYYQ